MSAWREYLVPVVVFALVGLLPAVLSQYWLHIVILILMWAFLSSAWNILGGFAGQHSLGHGLFMGIGAYLTAYMANTFALNPWISLVLGALLAGLAGAFVGYATFRSGIKGAYFALVTIAITEAAVYVVSNWRALGQASGLSVPLVGTGLSRLQFDSKAGFFYIILVLALLAVLLSQWLSRRRFGYRLIAVRENEDAAEALGVDTLMTKIQATALSAALCAVGGTFYVQYFTYVEPRSVFGETISIQILLYSIIGGLGTVWGPIVGAAVLVPIAEWVRGTFGQTLSGLNVFVYGAILVLVMLFMPRGIVGVARSLQRRIRPRREGVEPAASSAGAGDTARERGGA
ncbi:MAG: branched-chain amino acid ABC transporter permease [Actinobacteria bacterium]|jgi:branched-chain amino acid transport system permease protein|nr:branched-chain amino acid ABC transporter permease [Actinomycetota bacterium]